MYGARFAHYVNLDDEAFHGSGAEQQLNRVRAEVRARLQQDSVAVDPEWLARLQALWDRLSGAPLGPGAARAMRPALPDLLDLAEGAPADYHAGLVAGLMAVLQPGAFPDGLVASGSKVAPPPASAPSEAETELCPFCGSQVSLQQPMCLCAHCDARRIRRVDMLLSAPFAAFNWYGAVLLFILAGPVWVALAWDSLSQPSALQAFPMGKLGLFCGGTLTLVAIPLYRLVRRLLDRLLGYVWVR